MADSRQHTLLFAAARAFEDGRDPFSDDWLIEQKVTGEECISLSATIGTILAGYLVVDPETRTVLLAEGAALLSDAPFPPGTLRTIIQGRGAMKAITEMEMPR